MNSSAVIVRYTYAGDATLDGSVDTIDFNALAFNFAKPNGGDTVRRDWSQGDFDYSGSVDTIDFNLLAANFGKLLAADGGGAGASNALGSLVPEPTSLTLVGLAAAGLMARRRRR